MMVLDRREFLKLMGFATAGMATSLPSHLSWASEPPQLSTGKRYGMVIDVGKCLENDVFDACIKACVEAHNIPIINNPKEEVKWIWSEHFEHAFHEQAHSLVNEKLAEKKVLVMCNHCNNPPCVRVCPTQSTWKREDGIVMMDPHRCIGCRYCIAACPYGSRSFNWRDPRLYFKGRKLNVDYPTRTKGVVEKCTFCEERLSEGRSPACVEACKNGEMLFGDLNDPHSSLRKILAQRFSIRRKPSLGTEPSIYYLV